MSDPVDRECGCAQSVYCLAFTQGWARLSDEILSEYRLANGCSCGLLYEDTVRAVVQLRGFSE